MKPPWWNILGSETCMPGCAGTAYDLKKDCCDKLGNFHQGEAPTWWGLSCSKEAWQQKKDEAAIKSWENKTKGKDVESVTKCDGNGGFQIDYGLWQDVPCGMKDCVTLHEKYHIGDFKNFYPNACKKGQHAGESPIVPTADIPKFEQQTECAAHLRVSAPCLDQKASQAPSNACKSFLKQQRIDDIDETLKIHHCRDLGY
ncbi:MAG: hypothetical protein HY922_08290 [Elusimicrobia bacterium]|nr:hypothetical protein [Elusimicrobiota bacterium]